MSHKRRRKTKRKKVPTPRLVDAEVVKVQPYGGREVGRDILKGVLVITIVMALNFWIEHTTFGEHMKVMAYNFLQTRLSADDTPVTIVDITDLKPEVVSVDGEDVTATPRDRLQRMIAAIVDQRPRAIGVDIDFSPDEGSLLPSDPEFFQYCLALKNKGVPVFLGVRRTITQPSDEWLGSKKFEPLAANILVPNDNKRMLNVLEVGERNKNVTTGESKTSRSMSALLAEAYGTSHTSSAGHRFYNSLGSLGLLEKFHEQRVGPDLLFEDFLIDYSPLDSIYKERIKTKDPDVLRDSSNRERLEDKIVLIGDATIGEAADAFVIPARDKPYPGIFVHACAAYTLIEAPLYELTIRGRIVLDLALSGIILLGVVLIKYRYKDVEQRDTGAEKWRGHLTLLVVLSAIVIGVVFVRITRIMWDDFFLGLLLLVFHPSIEHHLESLWKTIKRAFSSRDRVATEKSVKISCCSLILTAIVILNCNSRVVAQRHPSAIIEEFSGVVLLKHDGKQVRLNAKTDLVKRLYPGDSIRCTKGSKAKVSIGGKKHELDENSGWFVISDVVVSRSDLRQKQIQLAINEYGRIGGRNRRIDRRSIVFSPADESVVDPESFIIRWIPAKKNCVGTIEIQNSGGDILWQEKNVDSATGELKSDAARQALERYRDASDVATLRLKLNDSCRNTDHTDFTLLSISEEDSLKEELKLWDSDGESLMNHLGRAAVFYRHRMFSNVAEEYEQALALAPMSRDLLLRTIDAQSFIGNLTRAKELQRAIRRN